MPKITEATVEREAEEGVCGAVELLRYSDTGGLTQFGAIVEILSPGGRSAIKHWHAAEDEMVLMLEGVVVLQEGDTETELRPGEVATFKAGAPLGHCLENRSDGPARYLVIGTRYDEETVTYPDHDRVLTRWRDADGIARHAWHDTAGAPASNPYAR